MTCHEGNGVATGQWPEVARNWKQLDSPLRPAPSDLALIRKGLLSLKLAAEHSPRVLMMGVTPEVYQLPWPDGWSVRSIDWTPAMVEHVWRGPREHVTLDDWREMPFASGSFDVVTCDGGMSLLRYPDDQWKVCRRLASIIAPGGLFITRLYAPPSVSETPQVVLDDLFGGRIRDLNCLKLRLGMAMQNTSEEGVAPRQVWQTLRDAAKDWETLAERLGWPVAHLSAIDAYRSTSSRYYFVTEREMTDILCTEEVGFELVFSETPDYELGDRCPTAVYRRL